MLGSQACHALATAYTPLLVVLCAAAGAEFLSPATTPVVKPGAKGHGTSFPGSALRDSMDTGLLTPDGGREGQQVGHLGRSGELCKAVGRHAAKPAVCTVSRTCVQRQQRLQRQRSFGCAFWL